MDAPTFPLYALIDRRQDGAPRVVGEFADPEAARHAADALRSAGSPAEVVLVTSVRDDDAGAQRE